MTSTSNEPTILLLDTTPGAGLAVVRSLGQSGFDVRVARIGRRSIAERSRYCRGSYDLGDAFEDATRVQEALLRLLLDNRVDLVLPLTDAALELVNPIRREIEQLVRHLCVPRERSYEFSHDKAKLAALASEIGIPTPSGTFHERGSDLSAAISAVDRFPVYARPVSSALLRRGRIETFNAAKITNRTVLEDFLRFHLDRIPVLLQYPVPGRGEGVYALCRDGKIIASMQQRRLHEPQNGGSSSYRECVPSSPQLEAYAAEIIRSTGWSGPAMVEFKGDGHSWALIELNGRFWGSLPLTIAAGLDLPALMINEALDGISRQPPTLRYGFRMRHLRPDITWLYRATRSSPQKTRVVAEWLSDWRYVLRRREGLDVESTDDPVPGIAEWVFDARRALAPLTRRFNAAVARVDQVRRSRGRSRPAVRRVLFLCAGNICRSPFAEATMRQLRRDLEIRSRGTIPESDRRVPSIAEDVARRDFGVDLHAHRSAPATVSDFDWADLIVAMDTTNLAAVRNVSRRALSKCILLGDADESGSIRDPYGRDRDAFLESYAHIRRSIDALSGMLVD